MSNPTSNLNFALRLHTDLAALNPSTNIFLAPASVEANLAMAVNGARGATKRAVLQAIGLPENHSLRKLNGLQSSLIAALAEPHALEAASPSIVRARRDMELNRAFLAKTRKFYRSATGDNPVDGLRALDLASDLFNDLTGGVIETVFADADGEPGVLLGTTSGVDSTWLRAFDPNKTKARPFTLLSGEDKRLPMMFQIGSYRYLQADDFQAVSLPYSDGRTSMYVFVPNRGVSFEDFRSQMTPESWQSWMQAFGTAAGAIALPRLRLECISDLLHPLSAMGMGAALDGRRADFGALCSRTRLHISAITHKASVEFKEEGVDLSPGDQSPEPDQDGFFMAADRPFVCAVCDDESGTPLFIGSIVDP